MGPKEDRPNQHNNSNSNSHHVSNEVRGSQVTENDLQKSPVRDYWTALVEEAASGMQERLDNATLRRLKEEIGKSLEDASDQHHLAELSELHSLDGGRVDDELATETRRLQREQKLGKAHSEALSEEKSSLKSFKRAIEAIQAEEKSQEQKLHPNVKAFLSHDNQQIGELPPVTLSKFRRHAYEVNFRDEQPTYSPDSDPFLRGLSNKLAPILELTSKKAQKRL